MAKQNKKKVTILARIEFKCDKRKVVYVVRSSDGEKHYYVSFFDGKSTGCDCPSYKPLCKHRLYCQEVESLRTILRSPILAIPTPKAPVKPYTCIEQAPLNTVIRNNRFVELSYDELDEAERRAMYISLFSPCDL
jgi:hypothetical protein